MQLAYSSSILSMATEDTPKMQRIIKRIPDRKASSVKKLKVRRIELKHPFGLCSERSGATRPTRYASLEPRSKFRISSWQ